MRITPFTPFALRALALALSLIPAPAFAADPAGQAPVYAREQNLAISGYDAVAYFTENWPRRGLEQHQTEWNGAVWRFVSAENQAKFEAAPESYAPQYGGYCAYAVSRGYTAPTDPTAWEVVDGKLYLNYNHAVRARWKQDIPGHITRADAHWPGVLENN